MFNFFGGFSFLVPTQGLVLIDLVLYDNDTSNKNRHNIFRSQAKNQFKTISIRAYVISCIHSSNDIHFYTQTVVKLDLTRLSLWKVLLPGTHNK